MPKIITSKVQLDDFINKIYEETQPNFDPKSSYKKISLAHYVDHFNTILSVQYLDSILIKEFVGIILSGDLKLFWLHLHCLQIYSVRIQSLVMPFDESRWVI